MTIYFANQGHIDLDVVRLMGVSVKLGENPIGYFGTGLKYAISTLLRTGHQVILETSNVKYEFTAKPKEIRGKSFNVVYMNEEQLGFTTDLGRDWEVWQAYRELHSNCIDEAGTISTKPMSSDTVFIVKGEQIEEAFHERWKIFLHSDPLHVCDGVEIHAGSTQYVYYRGVRVHTLPKRSAYTYNITSPMRLTEDRTAVSAYDIQYRVESRIPTLTDEKMLTRIFKARDDIFELNLDFSSCGAPSEEFLDFIENLGDDMTVSESARKLLRQNRLPVNNQNKMVLTKVEQEIVEKACELLGKLNVIVNHTDFEYHEDLGKDVMGACEYGVMKIARRCIAQGIDYTAITMYEEWIHKVHGYSDNSRGMQQYLFDKILQLVKELP